MEFLKLHSPGMAFLVSHKVGQYCRSSAPFLLLFSKQTVLDSSGSLDSGVKQQKFILSMLQTDKVKDFIPVGSGSAEGSLLLWGRLIPRHVLGQGAVSLNRQSFFTHYIYLSKYGTLEKFAFQGNRSF